MRLKSILLVACILLAGSFSVQAEELIAQNSTLTLEQCIRVGLQNNPDIAAYTGNIKIYQSRVGQARSAYYPTLNLALRYSHDKMTPPPSMPEMLSYSAGLHLNQNIYDFGQTSSRLRIQNLNLGAVISDLDAVSNQVVLNIKQAYYAVLKAERNKTVAQESVRMFEEHLDRAKAFFAVGTKPRFDVTRAEVDLSSAKLELIKAENALKVARVMLNNSMGVPSAPDYLIADNLSFRKYQVTPEEALVRAYANRPDLKGIIVRKEAALESVRLARKQYLPVIFGTASYSQGNDEFPLKEGWGVSVTFGVPIFNGFETKYRVAEARAAQAVLQANEESLRQSIILEVQQACLSLKEVEESVSMSELLVKQAQESSEIAQGRYDAGVGSPIEVTDAQVTYVNARKNYIETLYRYQIARESLQKAMGLRSENAYQ
ncbi:MAG: TolC family protein [Candidatus Omnitrophica bacterium]|nr:TolC family protein [Candidatus Omnitrophota bacterium]